MFKKISLVIILVLIPLTLRAESKVFFAPAGQVSALVIAEQSNFARIYAMLTNGLARMHYDDTTKTLDSLKFALLMNSFVTSSPSFAQEWFARRPLSPDKEDEVAFVQSDPTKFENNKATIKGQLVINTIRKDVTFEATLNKFGRISKTNDLYDDGAQTLGFSMHGNFKRSDFSLAGNGAGSGENSAFNDDAILMLDIVAK
jgi:polyisoprenoid-binding protein YceI